MARGAPGNVDYRFPLHHTFFDWRRSVLERLCRSSLIKARRFKSGYAVHPLLKRGIPEGWYPLPFFAIEHLPIVACSAFPVVRQIARFLFECLVFSFPSFYLSSIHWTACPNSEFNKAEQIFLGPKAEAWDLRPMFCWISDLVPFPFTLDKDMREDKIIKRNWKDKLNQKDVFETNKFLTL